MKRKLNRPLIYLFCAQVSNGYADEFDDLLAMSFTELLNVKVTSATLTEHSITTIPAATTVFTDKEISRIGVDYLHELLSFVPGYQAVRAMDYSYQYSVSSRGLKSGSSGREVLYLINGIPINSPRNGNEGGAFMYPVANIKRLEVIRGPGASIYGTNAVTGVVNIVTC